MNYYQILLLTFLFISSTLSYENYYEISYGVGEPLYEPERIDLTASGSKLVLYVRLCKYSVTDRNEFLYIRMTRYCYCTDKINDESCSYPGPTLILKGNTKISVEIRNQLTGEDSTTEDPYWNHLKDMDVVNLHTHGLHVSPFEDDILVKIEPGNKFKFAYTFGYHYPGTFWYHTHHHGSVAFQLDLGLVGAIKMTSDNMYEKELNKYKENILLFNWQYPIPGSECIPDASRGGSKSKLCPGRTPSNDPKEFLDIDRNVKVLDDSICFYYCQMPTFQLDASEYVYDVQTDLKPNDDGEYKSLYFTNGQLHPVINDLQTGVFRRLRLVNSIGNFFIQFKFPNECNTYLIAMDGIYITNEYMNYDLSEPSHLNELLVSPGARADVLIKCNEAGTYDIYSSQNNQQDPEQLPATDRITDGYKLFSIKVSGRSNSWTEDGTTALPKYYPAKLKGTYLEDLYNYRYTNTICDCHRPFEGEDFNPNSKCFFEFGEDPNTLNDKPFDTRNSEAPLHIKDSLSLIRYDRAYEFIIDNEDGHVYHQHTYPWQYMENVGRNGFIAFKGVYGDNFGNDGGIQNVRIRMWTRDYWGIIIQHCHILEHEDEGMMGFVDVLYGNYDCPFEQYNNNNNNNNNMNGNVGDIDSDSDSDSYSRSGSGSSEMKIGIVASKTNARATAFETNAVIGTSVGVFMLICGLALGGIFYNKRKKKHMFRTRVATNEVENDDTDDTDDDEIIYDKTQIIYDDDDDEIVLENEGKIQLVDARPKTNTSTLR